MLPSLRRRSPASNPGWRNCLDTPFALEAHAATPLSTSEFRCAVLHSLHDAPNCVNLIDTSRSHPCPSKRPVNRVTDLETSEHVTRTIGVMLHRVPERDDGSQRFDSVPKCSTLAVVAQLLPQIRLQTHQRSRRRSAVRAR